jgi:hypothetical protein
MARGFGPLLFLLAFAGHAGAQVPVEFWYPLQPGNSWVYAKEALDGYMGRPDVEHWTTEETVVSTAREAAFDAVLVTLRVRVLDHRLPPGGYSNMREQPERHLLVRHDCVWIVDGADAGAAAYVRDPLYSTVFHTDFLHSQVPADYCFPMAVGKEWGRAANTSPSEELIWRLDRTNGDPYGPPGERTFHMATHLGAGEYEDRWFTEGIGLVQENSEHHGTYDEDRVRLLRATINGHTQSYDLPSARTAPLGESDCEGPGWRHYVRADGTPFHSRAECVAYANRRRR